MPRVLWHYTMQRSLLQEGPRRPPDMWRSPPGSRQHLRRDVQALLSKDPGRGPRAYPEGQGKVLRQEAQPLGRFLIKGASIYGHAGASTRRPSCTGAVGDCKQEAPKLAWPYSRSISKRGVLNRASVGNIFEICVRDVPPADALLQQTLSFPMATRTPAPVRWDTLKRYPESSKDSISRKSIDSGRAGVRLLSCPSSHEQLQTRFAHG